MDKAQNPDDRPFHHYTAKHRVVAWISRNLFDDVTYTARRGLIQGMRRKGGLGWLPEFLGTSETPEETFWKNAKLKDLVIYDIGAYHGLLTLFFARQGRQVIGYEPNNRNHARLMENLRLNDLRNVTVRRVGIGAKSEVATMVASPAMMGGASIEGQTVTGLLHSHGPVVSEQIAITTLDDDIREMSLPAPDFVKIDIEGAELPALIGARETLRRCRPGLFIEMHGETLNLKRQNAKAVVAELHESGYHEILHIETGTAITASNCPIAAEGHLYCRR